MKNYFKWNFRLFGIDILWLSGPQIFFSMHIQLSKSTAKFHCWKIPLILALAKVASKTQYSPLYICKVMSIGFYSTFYIFYMHSFDNFFVKGQILMVVLFNNAYPVRSAISVWCFTHHSCYKSHFKVTRLRLVTSNDFCSIHDE